MRVTPTYSSCPPRRIDKGAFINLKAISIGRGEIECNSNELISTAIIIPEMLKIISSHFDLFSFSLELTHMNCQYSSDNFTHKLSKQKSQMERNRELRAC